MNDKKKKTVKTPPAPPNWSELDTPQIPPEILKKVQEKLQAKKQKKGSK